MCKNAVDLVFYINVTCVKDCFLKYEEKWFFVYESGG